MSDMKKNRRAVESGGKKAAEEEQKSKNKREWETKKREMIVHYAKVFSQEEVDKKHRTVHMYIVYKYNSVSVLTG